MSLNTFGASWGASPLPPIQRSMKGEADRRAALSAEIREAADDTHLTTDAAVVLNWLTRAWRQRRAATTLNELADAFGIGLPKAIALRDELRAAGLIDEVRIGTLGAQGYQPAAHVAFAGPSAPARKEEARPLSAADRAFRAQIGVKRHT